MDQLNERKMIPVKFYLIFLNEIHLFYGGNSRTCKIPFTNNNKIFKLVNQTKRLKWIFVVLNNNIKINLYYRCIDCGFKKELTGLLKIWTIYKAMLSCCLKFREKTDSKNPRVVKIKTGRIMVLSHCAVYCSKNWDLLKRKKLVEYQVA